MKVIGFAGRKQNGKTTVCDIIKSDLESAGLTVARVNFKDPLLAMHVRLAGMASKTKRAASSCSGWGPM